jgi:CTP synthase (UTP-ammonia lyase)
MDEALRIAIIGDYNFAYNSHNATNLALQHVENFLDQRINSYWLNEKECCEMIQNFISDYDGFILAPGPYRQPFYITSVIKSLYEADVPVIGTGDCFKLLIEQFFVSKGFDLHRERIISDNLIDGNRFTEIQLDRFSGEFEKLYMTRGNVEYSSSRYSVLPQYSDMLTDAFEIGARNQYFDPEILKSHRHKFFLFTMFCPQIISTQDIPHPLMIYFVKTVRRIVDMKNI